MPGCAFDAVDTETYPDQVQWAKVKVIQWKMLTLLLGHQFELVLLVYGQVHKLGQCRQCQYHCQSLYKVKLFGFLLTNGRWFFD